MIPLIASVCPAVTIQVQRLRILHYRLFLILRVLKYWSETDSGELAQLVERCDRTAEARGSNPLFSIE